MKPTTSRTASPQSALKRQLQQERNLLARQLRELAGLRARFLGKATLIRHTHARLTVIKSQLQEAGVMLRNDSGEDLLQAPIHENLIIPMETTHAF